ncbi:MAG: carboxypeptidase-like regulatory domain-containing protein [Planctomycetes bacterium]|nr:carboxypeptidase-like regulatory domain-containing protein [Planctomycetota bacterium]
MKTLRMAFLPVLLAAAGCAGTRDAGVVTLSAVDAYGRNASSFNFAVVEEASGKVVWSGVPAEGSTVRNQVKGGSYRLLVIGDSGATVTDLDVDGDRTVSARLSSGGAVRGEARNSGKPFSAEVWMPIPGKGTEKSSALSRIIRATVDGRFQIDRLPPGTWVLVVGSASAGYKEITVEVKDGKVTDAGYIEIP